MDSSEKQNKGNNKNTIYIEHCINCREHSWCTNHNEEKYKQFASIGKLEYHFNNFLSRKRSL